MVQCPVSGKGLIQCCISCELKIWFMSYNYMQLVYLCIPWWLFQHNIHCLPPAMQGIALPTVECSWFGHNTPTVCLLCQLPWDATLKGRRRSSHPTPHIVGKSANVIYYETLRENAYGPSWWDFPEWLLFLEDHCLRSMRLMILPTVHCTNTFCYLHRVGDASPWPILLGSGPMGEGSKWVVSGTSTLHGPPCLHSECKVKPTFLCICLHQSFWIIFFAFFHKFRFLVRSIWCLWLRLMPPPVSRYGPPAGTFH